MGIDIGTSQIKAGLFDPEGETLNIACLPTPTQSVAGGYVEYEPDALWLATVSVIRELLSRSAGVLVQAVGVASMAEAGLLVDRESGRAKSAILPWFDPRPSDQASFVALQDSPQTLFQRTGLRPSYKFALCKLLWLRSVGTDDLSHAVWLSVADYIVFRMTGVMATDPTLAARTYLFDIKDNSWDCAWMRHFYLDSNNFPEVAPSGTPVGQVSEAASSETGLVRTTPVAIAGHDHICSLLATGIVHPGPVLDSVGTAESVLGVLDSLQLDDRAFQSELSFVPHLLEGTYCWLGGLSAAGGSVEWIRTQLAEEPIPYKTVAQCVSDLPHGPTGILYFPYLSGSGAPHHNGNARAAFVGLSGSHSRAHLLKAVFEGTAFATEAIRRTAEKLVGRHIDHFVAVGGGSKDNVWMQIRADVTGCSQLLPAISEATALGAALAAGLGCGAVLSLADIVAGAERSCKAGRTIVPHRERHTAYRVVYEKGYAVLGDPIRRYADSPSTPGGVSRA